MRGFAGFARQLIEMRLRLVAKTQTANRASTEVEQPQSERIAAGFAVPPDQTVLFEDREQTVNSALVEIELAGDFAGGQFARVLG
jgi:hypothetical protein